MRVSHPQTPRQLALWSASLVLIGLCIPAVLWLAWRSVPVAEGPAPTLEIVRVARSEADRIPADWQPPDLNPQLEVDVRAIPETLPLSQTATLSAALPLASQAFSVTAAALVVSEALNVRDGPGGEYVPLITLNNSTVITVVGRYAGWYQVVTPDQVLGWVDSDFVATNVNSATLPTPAAIPDAAPVLAAQLLPEISGANLRQDPSLRAESLEVVRPAYGDVVLLKRFDDWYQVRTPGGSEGWIAAELITTTDYIARRVPVLTASPAALAAVRLARQYIGYPYVWGAETPRAGFDCSGLVKYVYGRLGLDLPHGSREQWSARYGEKIYDQALLRPGDIIFFENTYRRGISHVGIYAGDRLIIQAISESVGVRVSSLDEAYWAERYVGAIRPFP